MPAEGYKNVSVTLAGAEKLEAFRREHGWKSIAKMMDDPAVELRLRSDKEPMQGQESDEPT